ncbi:MAG: M56 family metallopeptidase [Lachnospiraceae bacterium]|nr:M56 family metallopeptidase [Lachnospiraceae bacterium]
MSLLDMSFSGAVLIIAVIVVRTVLMNRIPKKTFLVLWEIAFLRLLIPFCIPFMFSIHTLISQALSNSTYLGANVNKVLFAWTQRQHITTQQMEKISSDMLSSHFVWFVIWCIGMIVLTLFFAVSYLRCQIEFRTSLPVCNDYVEQWLKEHSIKRSISIRQSDRILTPLTYGILHPVILMPKKTDWKNTKQLGYVLSHEYMHICHLDILKKLIATAVLCIHWFNPMVWVMYILFNRDVELTCDERVVRQFGEKSKAVYSLILINMEEKQSGLLPFCNNFSKNAIEERITAIMKMKKVTIVSFVTACLVVGGIVTAFATSAQASSTPPSLDEQESVFDAPNMQPYGKGDNYYYLSEDYVLDGETIFTAGYYEAIQLVDGCETRIFVPIDPTSYERLPSDGFSDGTIMEIDGKDYEIHIDNNQYTAVLKDQQYIYFQF